jgi:hypothetical protein
MPTSGPVARGTGTRTLKPTTAPMRPIDPSVKAPAETTRTIKTGGKGAWGMPVSTGGKVIRPTTRTIKEDPSTTIKTGGTDRRSGGRTIKTGGGTTTSTISGGGRGGRGGRIGFGGASGTKTITTGGTTTTTVKNEVVTDPREAMTGRNGSGYRGK